MLDQLTEGERDMTEWDELGIDFDTEVRDLALSQRPRLFAVVQVFGENEDAVVAA
ncbi:MULTISPECIES: hypothetical protein [Streptomyces]|uniref:hypothetical protein n=1 Tax=Streptomyces TaxID=1883 RepID=UPI00186AE7E4|nr:MULTISPECIES: hypothetical protein [Streptomyces]